MYALTENKLEFYGKHLRGLNEVARDVACKILVNDLSVCIYDVQGKLLKTFVKSDVKEIGVEQELDVENTEFYPAGLFLTEETEIETIRVSFIRTDKDLIVFQA
jgi:hypothetical protein